MPFVVAEAIVIVPAAPLPTPNTAMSVVRFGHATAAPAPVVVHMNAELSHVPPPSVSTLPDPLVVHV
jgi:hypothetical protein